MKVYSFHMEDNYVVEGEHGSDKVFKKLIPKSDYEIQSTKITDLEQKIKTLEGKLVDSNNVVKFYAQMSVMDFKADFQQICTYSPLVTDCIVGSKAKAFVSTIK